MNLPGLVLNQALPQRLGEPMALYDSCLKIYRRCRDKLESLFLDPSVIGHFNLTIRGGLNHCGNNVELTAAVNVEIASPDLRLGSQYGEWLS